MRRTTLSLAVVILAFGLSFLGSVLLGSVLHAQDRTEVDSERDEREHIRTAQPAIWFCPLDPLLRPEVGYSGSAEYMQLFSPDAPWPAAASRVGVFKIYPQWITRACDADLRDQFADLKRRGIALALEFGVLSESEVCGRGVEGFGGRSLLNAARRIQRLGGKLQYVAMDEPIFFGTLYRGANRCGWTVEQMAQNAAVNLKALIAEFPNVLIGDIEPLPVDDTSKGWLDQYARGLDALQSALGFSLAFFHSDVLWSSDQWPSSLANMRVVAQARELPFGVIYNGNAEDRSDASWLASAESHMTGYELGADPPDHVIFQSWHAYPKKLLPELSRDSFTFLINRYFRTRSKLSLSLEESLLSGSLSLDPDTPVPNATVRFAGSPLSGDGMEAEYVVEGTTPAGVKQIVFGARINLECSCSGQSEFLLRSFRVDQLDGGGSPLLRDFSSGMGGWGFSDPSLVTLADGRLQVSVPPARPLLINSAPVPFTAENAAFRLTVTAQVKPLSAGSGYFTIIFLGDKEISRFRIPIRAADINLGTAVTLEDGLFQLPLPPLAPGDWLLSASFEGTDELWPARSDVTAHLAATAPLAGAPLTRQRP